MKKVRRAFALLLSAALLLGVLEPAAIAAGPVTGANLQTTIQTPRSIEPQSGTCGDNATWSISAEGVLTISGTGAIGNYTENDAPWQSLRADITAIVIEKGITRIGNYAFHDCRVATSAALPEGLVEIGENAFRSCGALEEINLPPELTTIGIGAFYYTSALTSITIPGSVETFLDAFNDSGLETVTIENGVDEVDSYAFCNCYHLKSVTLPDSIQSIGNYAFSGCQQLEELDLPDGITSFGEYAFANTAISEFEFPEGASINAGVLQNTSITSIVIPQGVTTIGQNAFYGCENLATVTFPSTLTRIEGGAFSYTALTSLHLPDGVEFIGHSAFRECNVLETVTMTDSVTTMDDNAFDHCDILRSVTLSDQIETIGLQTFSQCKNLETIHLPASLKTIGNDAFQYCESLRSLTLPDGTESIGSLAFRGCSVLEAVVIPASVTSIDSGWNNNSVFAYCGVLTLYVTPGSHAETYAKERGITYEYLAEGKTVRLDVVDEDGKPLDEVDYSIRWYENGERLNASGGSIGVDGDTQALTYEVALGEELAFQYQTPGVQTVELTDTVTTLECQLQPLPQVTLTGAVTDAEGEPLKQASVTISQSAGIYEKTQRENLPVDSDGSFSIQLPVLETTVTAEMDGYYTRSRTVPLLDGEGTSNNVGDIALPAIPEARVELSFAVKSAVAAGETPATTKLQTGNGITVSAYNVTTRQNLTGTVFQYPYLVLGDNNAKSGDKVRITATDTWGKMTAEPVTVKLTDDPWTAAITFTENGAVSALLSGDFPKRAAVFDGEGNLVQTATVDGQLFTSQPLPAGSYQVAFLEKTSQISAIPTLGYLNTLGLVQGENYVLRSFSVENGKITTLDTVTVPPLEMSYLVAENTSVSVNKATVPAGQYVTVRAAYELEEKVSSTGQTLVVDLPEGCSLVKNSVTVDGVSANYSSSDDGTVNIPTNKEKATVLFYVTAQGSGEFSVTCSLAVTPKGTGQAVTQPLGSGFFSATAMQLRVLDKTSKDEVRVSGKAAPNGTVEIYDGSRLAGTATANAAGTWFAEVDLQPRYQFEVHDLQAKVTSGGTETLSDVARVTYDANYIDFKSVTMINTAHPPTNLNPMEYVTEMVAAEYQGKSFYYRWDPNHPVFTFTVEFDENDPERLSGVTVVAANAQGEETLLPCQYQASAGAWTTSGTFDTVESLPVSLSVRYSCDGVPSVFGWDEAGLEALIEDTQEYVELVDESLEQNLENLSLGEVTLDGEMLSMPLLYTEGETEEGNVIGTFTAGQVAYDQFNKEEWEELDCLHVTMEDGTEYYTRSIMELVGTDVVITRWTAFPNDQILTKDVIILQRKSNESSQASQGMRLTANQSFQSSNSRGISVDYSDFLEINNTLAQCLPGWAGTLASGINTLGEWNILRSGIASYMSVFEIDHNTTEKLLDAKCDDGTPRLSSAQRSQFAELLAVLDGMVEDYPRTVYMMFAGSFFADYLMGKVTDKMVTTKGPQSPNPSGDSDMMEAYKQYLKQQGNKQTVTLTGKDKFALGLLEFDVNALKSAASDTIMNALSLNLDAQEYMHSQFEQIHQNFEELQKQIQMSYRQCKDDEEDDGKEDGGNGDGGDGRNGANSLAFDMTAGLDPSGYVCEAVPSNVLEGVTVTLYKQDDDKGVQWNATDYDQTNPVTTNADGVYAWDVPAGQWKVKFEKESYKTACSEWLVVPPPRTDVNVSLVSEELPEIASISAYQKGVRVEFSQYMDIKSVKEKLSVTTNGNKITGSVEAENAEGSLNNPEIEYASVFFFTFTNGPESGEVTVSAAGAKNYAENIVQETAGSKTATIEVEPTGIAVCETASVGCDGTVTLELRVEPPAAGANKTIQVASSTSYLFEVKQNNATVTQVTTDEEGKATLTLSGKLPGVGQLTFSLDGTSLTAATQVAVGDTTEVLSACAEVTANPVPGSVAPGKEVTLQTETAGAVIYYTLNKTCPCDLDNEARKEYTGPIEITEDTYIIAYAVKEGYEDSKTSHFSYTVKEENPPVVEPGPGGSTPSRKPTVTVSGTGGTAVAQSSGVVVITPATGYKIAKVLVNGQEVAIPADGNLTGLQPSDKVTVTFEKISESVDLPFTDLAEDAWYSGAVEYVYAHGLMRGMSETAFAPNTSLTRAQAVQILYNLEGQPVVSGTATFTDAEHWAKSPIVWAQQTGVVDGYEDNSFRPENPISRQEFAQMMYNYAKYKGYDLTAKGNLDAFPDADKMGAWAEPSLAWANGNKLINGHDDGTLDPGGITIRAQAASILMRFDLNIVK
ncbi:leucine-rich repeat protein [Acutalibacter sp. LFL-21]|nr:leucine-rich repeat protein [Acutalibacter sp. LFL-21]